MTDRDDEPLDRLRGRVPVPDPTLLTTQQLIREIKALQEIVDAKLAGMDKATSSLEILINEKIDAVAQRSDERHRGVQMQFSERNARFDQAITGAMEVAKAARATLEDKTAHLQELHNEKFLSVAAQFEQRDIALNSTLQATKETFREQNNAAAVAIAKSEASTVKQIDQIQQLLQSATAGLEGKIADIKDRLTTIEGKTIGQATANVTRDTSTTQWVGIIGLVVGGFVGVGGLVLAMTARPDPIPVVERVLVEPTPTSPSGVLR